MSRSIRFLGLVLSNCPLRTGHAIGWINSGMVMVMSSLIRNVIVPNLEMN